MISRRLPWHFLPVLAAALVLALAIGIESLGWIGRPFPGFMVLTDGRVDGQQFLKADDVIAAIRVGDRVTACDGRAMADGLAVDRYVASRPVGTPIRYRLAREGRRAGDVTLTLPTRRLRLDQWVSVVAVFWLDGLLHLLLGAYVLLKRPEDPGARSHWWFCLSLAGFLIAVPEVLLGHHAGRLAMDVPEALIGVTGLTLALWIPRPWPILTRRPAVARWLPGVGLVIAGGLVTGMLVTGSIAWDVAIVGLGALGALAIPLAAGWVRRSATSSRSQRQAAGVILWGLLLAFLPSTVLALGQACFSLTLPHQDLAQLALPLAPAAIALAIVRHHLFAIPVLVRRATRYTVLVTSLSLVYLGVTAVGVALLDRLPPGVLPAHLAGLGGALVVTLLWHPWHRRLRRMVDRIFLGERADALATLTDLNRIVPGAPADVAAALLTVVRQALAPTWAALVVDGTVLACQGAAPETTILATARPPARDLGPLTAVLAAAPAEGLCVRLASSWGPPHLLLLGPKADDMPFTADEQALLRAVAVQGGVALDGASLRARHGDLLVQEGIARRLADERRQVLRQVLHDQRSDLMAIALAVDLARRKPGHEGHLAMIRRSVSRIERFLAEKTGPVVRQGVRTSVVPVLQQVVRLLGPQLREQQQHLAVTLPEGDCHVGLTAVELDQVVMNLVDNARKFAPAHTTIRLGARPDGARLVLSVADEGPGIPAALLAHLGSGRRGDGAVPGQGFGLQIVCDLVAKAGGAVTWHNADPGAVVTVTLPVAAGDDTPAYHPPR